MTMYVVDVNMLQSEDLAQHIKDEAMCYVLPDVALVEMCKHPACQLTMKLGLAVFEKIPSRVYATLSISEAMRDEIETLHVSRRDSLLSNHFSKFVRGLIKDLASGSIESNLEIQEKFSNARVNLMAAELNADDAKARTQKLLTLLEKGLHKHMVKAIRSPGFPSERIIDLAFFMANMYSGKMIPVKSGFPAAAVDEFVGSNALIFRYNFLLARGCLLYVRNGGNIDALKPEKELNNQLDFDYVLTASYFNGLLSNDKRMMDAYHDLLVALSSPRKEVIERIFTWFEELEAANS